MNKTGIDHKRERMWFYLLLLNLVIPFYFMLQEPLYLLIPGSVGLIGLAITLLMTIRMQRNVLVLTVVQLMIILTLGFVYSPMYLYLIFIIVYSFTALSLRMLIGITSMFAAGLIGAVVVSGHIGNLQFWFNMLPPLFGGAVLPYVIRISSRYREMNERLQAATKQIERFAQQEERQRIARELHDTLGHTLSLIVLKSEVAEKLVHRAPDKAAAEAREIHMTASAGLKRMRELVTDMKVVRLAEEWEHARMLCAAANVQLEIKDRIHVKGITLTPLQESVLAMSVREALTNMVRHSQASACLVELDADHEHISCIVSDNGKGIISDPIEVSGNGIIGIKQRLALLEGQLHLKSDQGKGTRLLMEIPIVRRQL